MPCGFTHLLEASKGRKEKAADVVTGYSSTAALIKGNNMSHSTTYCKAPP